MSPEQARSILTHENIKSTALVLAALDKIQSEEFNLMEPHLRKMGKFSESDVVTASDKAIRGHACMTIPGNGHGVKMNLSTFLNSLKVVGMGAEAEEAMRACESLETLNAG